MRIHIKGQNGDIKSYTPSELQAYLQPNGSMIGLCPTREPIAQYLFTVTGNELRRYPIRINTRSTVPCYSVFSDNDFGPEIPFTERPPQISKEHVFLTPEEITQIIDEEKKCPNLEGSPLSREQQELLYSGVVVPGLGISIHHFLNEYIFTLRNPEKVLQAAIGKTQIEFSEEESQEKSALESLRYNFLAPNRIVFFDKRLYPDASHKPTVGAILDFYTYCMQTALKKLGHETVAIANLRTYSDRSRAGQLGDLQYHFTEDEIHEPHGTTGVIDVIFRFVILLLTPENQTTEAISALINNPGHTDFLEHKIALYRAITDLITAIETDSITKIRSYLSAYDYIDATLPREGWENNLLPHLQIAQLTLSSLLSVDGIIQNNFSVNAEQRVALLEETDKEEIVDKRVVEACILLSRADILTDQYIRVIKSHIKPVEVAAAFCALKNAGIINDNNCNFAQTHRYIEGLSFVLTTLYKVGMLNQSNLDIVKSHDYLSDYFSSFPALLYLLKNENLLTQENFDVFRVRNDLDDCKRAIAVLTEARILNAETCNLIKRHREPSNLAYGLKKLHEENLYSNETYRNATIAAPEPFYFAKALVVLKNNNILNDENVNAIKALDYPTYEFVTSALVRLHKKDMLDSNNRHIVSTTNISTDLIKILDEANILNHDSFNLVHAMSKNWFWKKQSSSIIDIFYLLHSKNLITKDNFNAIASALSDSDVSSEHFPKAIAQLKKSTLLTQENITAIFINNSFPEPKWYKELESNEEKEKCKPSLQRRHKGLLLCSIVELGEANILSQTLIDEINASVNGYAVVILAKGHILTKETRSIVENCRSPSNVAEILVFLKENNLFNTLNCNVIGRARYESTSKLIDSLKKIVDSNKKDILTTANLNSLASHRNPDGCANALIIIDEYQKIKTNSGFFSQTGKDSLKIISALKKYAQGDENALDEIYDTIPGKRLKNILEQYRFLNKNMNPIWLQMQPSLVVDRLDLNKIKGL